MLDRLNRILQLMGADIASLPKGPGREAVNSTDPMTMWQGLQQLLGSGQAMKDPRSLRIMQMGNASQPGAYNNQDMVLQLIQAMLQMQAQPGMRK